MKLIWQDNHIEVKSILDKAELPSIRDHWDRLAESPTVDPDIYISKLDEDEGRTKPLVLLAYRGENVVGMLISRIETVRHTFNLNKWALNYMTARTIYVLDGGLIGADNSEVAKAFLQSLLCLFREDLADFAFLTAVDVNSPVHDLVKNLAHLRHRYRMTKTSDRYLLDLPETYDGFLAALSKKTRENIRRGERVIKNQLPDIDVAVFGRGHPGIKDIFSDMMSVFDRTYQARMEVSLLAESASQKVWEEASRLGQLVSVVTYLNRKPIAFNYARVYKSTAGDGARGYDPALKKYIVGQHTSLRLIRQLIQDGGIATYDFGPGAYEWKRHLANKVTKQAHITIYAPTMMGTWLKAEESLKALIYQFVLKISDRLKMMPRLKQLRRFGIRSLYRH